MSAKELKGQVIIQWLESWSPKKLAYDWDPVGLQVGSLGNAVHRVLITLDVTEEIVEEAIAQDVKLIIAHHPLLFKPLKKVQTDLPHGKIVQKLLQHNITVYAAHTNLDIADDGLNDWLAEALKLNQPQILVPTYTEKLIKLAVFVPTSHQHDVRVALAEAGAGFIGDYSHCSFRMAGIGTFMPHEGTSPYIGSQGKIEEVSEVKIETIFPESLEKKVISAMHKAHPYEEVAYDIYELAQPGKQYGLGRLGKIDTIALGDFAKDVKEALELDYVRVVGNLQAPITKVAVLGGSGSKYIMSAKARGADCIVTGDIDYHTALDAKMVGMHIIDAGHYIEKIMISALAKKLTAYAEKEKWSLQVLTAKNHKEPFMTL